MVKTSKFQQTLLFEDGSQMTIENPSLTNDETVYAFNDASEKNGVYFLNESEKMIADALFIHTKLLAFLFASSMSETAQKNSLKETIQMVQRDYPDTKIAKYLAKRFDKELQNFRFPFSEIYKDLDEMPLGYTYELIEEMEEQTDEPGVEHILWLLRDYAKKRTEKNIPPASLIPENQANEEELSFEEEPSFAEKHPLLTGIGRFAKNAGLTLVGEILQMSSSEIETLKQSDLSGVIETLYYTAESRQNDIDMYRAKCLAWQKRGMDYKYFNSISKEQQHAYLRSFGIDTKEKYKEFKQEIQEEIENQ